MRGGEFQGWGGPENEHALPKYVFLFYHSKTVSWHASTLKHRNATKACKRFVAESISAWPYGLLCLRGDLANPERDAICQIHPFLLRYLCNTPFMYPQQMADHLRVLSFKKKLPTFLALKCGISWESFCFFFCLDIALFCDVHSWSCTKTHAWI